MAGRGGVADSFEDHFQDALSLCQIRHPAYRQLLFWACQRGPGLLTDLSERGTNFAGPYPEEPHSKPRMHNAIPAASAVAEILADRAAGLGVTILTSHVPPLVLGQVGNSQLASPVGPR